MAEQERTEEFVRLFVGVEPRIYGLIRTMVFNRTDAEDLLQDVAAVLWREFDKFKLGTRFDRWALCVTMNQIRCFRQKHHRNVLGRSQELFDTMASTVDRLSEHGDDFYSILLCCMEKLDEHDRQMIRHRYEPGVTVTSLARELGRSVSAASRSLNRIQQKLLRCIHRISNEEERYQ